MKQTNSSEGFILKLLLPLFLFGLSLLSGVLTIDAAELSKGPDNLPPQGVYVTQPVISTEENQESPSENENALSATPQEEETVSTTPEVEITLTPQAELTVEPTEPSDTPLPVEYSLKVDANGGTIYMEEFGEYVDGYTLYRTVNSTAARYVLSDGREYSFEVADASKWGIVIPTPVLEGNYFQAWDNTNTSAVDSSNPNKVNQNLSKSFGVKAIWSSTPSATPTPIMRKFTFDSDGGSPVATVYREKGDVWGFVLPTPTKKGYVLDYWYNTNTQTKYNDIYRFENYTVNNDFSVKAAWKLADYSVNYNLKGGYFLDNTKIVESYTMNTPTFTLVKPVRKNYNFAGWYTNSKFTGSPVTKVTLGSTGDKNLYAKWVSAKPSGVTVSKLTNPTGKIKINLKKVSNVKGYQVKISTNKNFKSNNITYDIKNKTSFTYTNACKHTYYIKARAYVKDSTGNLCYGSYGKVKKIKVTKVAKEYTPTSTSATITSAKATSSTEMTIKGKFKKRLKSSDDYYYVVRVNEKTGKYMRVMAKFPKTSTPTVKIPITGKGMGNLANHFAFAIKKGKSYMLVSKPSYIKKPEAGAINTMKRVVPSTKKGMQGAYTSDLGSKNTLINIELNKMIASNGGGTPFVYNGKTYYFNEPHPSWDVTDKNNAGINVTFVILLRWDDNCSYLIHPSARVKGKTYYTLNTVESKGRETLAAMFAFLGQTYGQKNCYVSNWVLGNEVNAHLAWNYAGNQSLTDYMTSYADAFSLLYYGVKQGYGNARCYISLDHAWNKAVPTAGYSSHATLDAFVSALKKNHSNVKWNLAYHAYPAPLTAPDLWNNTGVTNNVNTTLYITPKNIEILSKYIKKNYGKDTRIILSEQGFTSSRGQNIQAAALAYTYYKAEFDDMIDAVIFRCEYDAQEEVAQGLAMGMMDRNGVRKEAYNVFKYMDTPSSTKVTTPYLSTIGAKSWSSIIPGYSAKKFNSMPKPTS